MSHHGKLSPAGVGGGPVTCLQARVLGCKDSAHRYATHYLSNLHGREVAPFIFFGTLASSLIVRS